MPTVRVCCFSPKGGEQVLRWTEGGGDAQEHWTPCQQIDRACNVMLNSISQPKSLAYHTYMCYCYFSKHMMMENVAFPF